MEDAQEFGGLTTNTDQPAIALAQKPRTELVLQTDPISEFINHLPFSPNEWSYGWNEHIWHLRQLIKESALPKELLAQMITKALINKIGEVNTQVEKLFNMNELPFASSLSARSAVFGIQDRVMFAQQNYLHLLHTIIEMVMPEGKPYIQELAMRGNLAPESGYGVRFSTDMMFSFPDMQDEAREIHEGVIRYYNQQIELEPPVPQAATSREILAGLALLVEDSSRKPLGIVATDAFNNPGPDSRLKRRLLSVEEFYADHYFGVPPNLEELQSTLNDPKMDTFLQDAYEDRCNVNILPIGGRVRIREAARAHNLRYDLFTLDYGNPLQLLPLLECVATDDVPVLLRGLWQFKQYSTHLQSYYESRGSFRQVDLYGDFVKGLAWMLENHTSYRYPDDKTLRLTERKAMAIIQETLLVIKNSTGKSPIRDEQFGNDLETIANAPFVLRMIVTAGLNLKQGDTPQFLKEINMPLTFVTDMLDFIGRHPEAKELFSTWFDFATVIEMYREETSPELVGYTEQKANFYRDYTRMNEQSATTSTDTDIARTTSVVLGARKHGVAPLGNRFLFAGSGNMQRLENVVLHNLEAADVPLEEVVAADLVDYSKEIPHDFPVKFVVADLTKDVLEQEGHFDYLFLPWSVISDILKTKDLKAVLERFSRLLTPGGVMVLDVPLPLGMHSYAETIKEQSGQHANDSLMGRYFEMGDTRLHSLFNIMALEKLIQRCYQAGFVPCNIPVNSADRAQIYQKIKEDDSLLTRNHEQGTDGDVFLEPLWQGNGFNRATLVLKNVGIQGVEEQLGALPSLLDALMTGGQSKLEN